MPKIANTNARPLVQRRQEFTGSNLFARYVGELYVVYSYGTHWPLWVYDTQINRWLENTSKYSQTTSVHKTRTNPYPVDPICLPKNDISSVVLHGGYDQWVCTAAVQRLSGGKP